MSDLKDKRNEIIKRAYEDYLKYMEPDEQKLRQKNLEIALDEFKEKLKAWKASDNVDFIIDFALSEVAQIFASVKIGKNVFADDFEKYIKMESVKKDLEKIIEYKFNIDDDTKLNFSIAKHDIIDSLVKDKELYKEEFRNGRPKILTGRLILMMFTELFTSIADIDALNDVCEKLEISIKDNNKKEKRYLAKHRQVRYMIDTYLRENNEYDKVNEIGRAQIAWHIREV